MDLSNITMVWKIKEHMELLWRIGFIGAVDVTYRFFPAKKRISNAIKQRVVMM